MIVTNKVKKDNKSDLNFKKEVLKQLDFKPKIYLKKFIFPRNCYFLYKIYLTFPLQSHNHIFFLSIVSE